MVGLYLVDVPRCGSENMAIDQRMLELAAELGQPLLRLYQWSQPTLSLGYFQQYASRFTHATSCELNAVRRSTGGGAIVHHFDWTYSLAMPGCLLAIEHGSKNRTGLGASQAVYRLVHDAVVEWLADHGVRASTWTAAGAGLGCVVAPDPPGACSFLCFERRAMGDVVAHDHKLLGSAQRRIQGALLQHGSLLLAKSPFAPSLTGLQQLARTAAGDLHDYGAKIRDAVEVFGDVSMKEVGGIRELLGSENLPAKKYIQTTWLGRL